MAMHHTATHFSIFGRCIFDEQLEYGRNSLTLTRQGLQGKARRQLKRSGNSRGLEPESPPVAAKLYTNSILA
jgi:hypothetical protein